MAGGEAVKRVGQIIHLRAGKFEEYKRLHAAVWPDVLETIRKANIRNYTIFNWRGYLFAYFEYIGEDFDADMKAIADDPITRDWWQLTDRLQSPVEGNSTGSVDGGWWTDMIEVFHTD